MATLILTTPLVVAAADGKRAETYNEVAIAHYGFDSLPKGSRGIMVMPQYGNTVEGEWVRGRHESPAIHIQDKPQILDGRGGEIQAENLAYSTILATMVTLVTDEAQPRDGGHNVAVGLERNALEWLAANIAGYEGTVT